MTTVEANAALISLAPELYIALASLVDAVEKSTDCMDNRIDRLDIDNSLDFARELVQALEDAP